MLKKRIALFVLSASMMLTLIPSSTFASNVKDRPFSFYVNSSVGYTTAARAKEDRSSTYVKINQVPVTYIYLDVQGFRPSSVGGTNYWADETIGGTQTARKGEWRVKQNVYENGGRSARLKFKRFTQSGTVSGVWSPDSVGNAPHLN
ncbi:hypothetical protein MUB24_00120 [Lederbergia sp. NSJ-179]|uniref:hypothetical protein n=1 Tax=Lederbergia sp. NSJ-179 TaxID=2931402 RepID=UPI001FD0492D|nr:hypothetical protein [Lederbergia sp. NSJ-179]MCJ7839332.1 hypothetical protein [Lederbergia sp. NSJ-179]